MLSTKSFIILLTVVKFGVGQGLKRYAVFGHHKSCELSQTDVVISDGSNTLNVLVRAQEPFTIVSAVRQQNIAGIEGAFASIIAEKLETHIVYHPIASFSMDRMEQQGHRYELQGFLEDI